MECVHLCLVAGNTVAPRSSEMDINIGTVLFLT